MLKELKAAILNWLFENENEWQRVNACTEPSGNIFTVRTEIISLAAKP